MIHIATVHHRSPRWIDTQLSYLRRHLDEPYRVVASLEGIDEIHFEKFDIVVPSVTTHAGKLNLLATVICHEADDDDLLVFLDGDAFPIADPMPTVRRALAHGDLVAARRDENLGDRQPHPLFCVTSVRTWRELPGDWSPGHPWRNEAGDLVSDVGGNLLFLLERSDRSWTPLLRSNRVNLHPVFYGIYGGVIFHHGAGFRSPITRLDMARRPAPVPPRFIESLPGGRRVSRLLARALRRRWMSDLVATQRRLEARIYQQAVTDPDFYLQFT